MIVRSFLTFFLTWMACLSPYGHAAVSSADIHVQVDQFLELYVKDVKLQYSKAGRIEYQISTIDSRLSMKDCSAPLNVEPRSPKLIGNISLKVSCTSGNLWSIYVPAVINLYSTVVQAKKPIARGSIISSDQIQLREVNISKLNGVYFMSLDDALGMQAKRTIQANKVIVANELSPPLMIKRGEAIILTASSGPLTVKIPGIAMRDGHRGQQISVQNRQSKRIIEARVTGPGQATVAM